MPKWILEFIVILFIPCCCLGQSGFSAPSPFTQSSSQLIKSSSDIELYETSFYADFDAFGNRQIDLNATGLSSRLDFEQEFLGADGLEDLGRSYRIDHQPILPLRFDPYTLTPAIDVIQRLGRFDILKPSVSLSIRHDSAILLEGIQSESSEITSELSTELTIKTAKDRVGRSTTSLGYRPTVRRYIENPGLNAIDHSAYITLATVFHRFNLALAANYSKATAPSLLLGAGTTATTFGQSVRADWNLREKIRVTTQLNNSIGTQSLALLSTTGQSNQEMTTTGLSGSLSFIKNEKLTFSPTISYSVNDQPVQGLGPIQLGGKTTVLNPFANITYIGSKKIEISLNGGVTTSQLEGQKEAQSGVSYEIQATYKPSSRLALSVLTGVATIPNPTLGITTTSDYLTFKINRNLFRNITGSVSYSESTQSIANNSSIIAALGDIVQESYILSLSSPLGQKSTLTLNYQLSSIQALSVLQRPDNTSISLQLSYQF